MTITLSQILIYLGAMLVLFATPGPVWVAVMARGLSMGYRGVWPLALGVALGDIFWPATAILGVSWLTTFYGDIILIFKIGAVVMLGLMGAGLIIWPSKTISEDSKLSTPGILAGFIAGWVVILANPKAIVFYLGFLPSMFDFTTLTIPDIIVICLIPFFVSFFGNTLLGTCFGFVRNLLKDPKRLIRINQIAGVALIGVAGVIGLGINPQIYEMVMIGIDFLIDKITTIYEATVIGLTL